MVLSKCSRRQITPCYGREEVDSIQLLLTKVNKYEEEEEKKSGSRPLLNTTIPFAKPVKLSFFEYSPLPCANLSVLSIVLL